MSSRIRQPAGSLANAFLVRELDREGVIHRIGLQADAIKRAEPLGPDVIRVIGNVFGGHALRVTDISTRSPSTVI